MPNVNKISWYKYHTGWYDNNLDGELCEMIVEIPYYKNRSDWKSEIKEWIKKADDVVTNLNDGEKDDLRAMVKIHGTLELV